MCGELRLAEQFVSINGEGQRAGELALFLRFTGCNLHCAWCDTAWANQPDAAYTSETVDTLAAIAQTTHDSGVRNVTLTGGEPLLQPEIGALITRLCAMGLRVEIETNGAVDIAPFVGLGAVFTMDYKLPASGMESQMKKENLALLRENDTLKFVCGSRGDVLRAKEIAEEYHPQCPMYLSAVFGQIEPAEIVDIMKAEQMGNFRLQLQLHKFIWDPMKRGV